MPKSSGSMKFHPAANLFPMEEETLDELTEDIRSHGLQCPIELCEDKIIDGRRRWKACRQAQVEPDFIEVEPEDPVAYVLSLNLHRRHLSPSQRSMVGARVREYYAEQAKERQGKRTDLEKSNIKANLPGSGQARDQAGKAVGVGGRSVDYASKVLANGSKKLIEAVDRGDVTVSKAAKVAASVPKREQISAIRNPQPPIVKVNYVSPEDECDIPDSVLDNAKVLCPHCGQVWPEGKKFYAR